MWCIGTITREYRERMYDLLDLYARPFRPGEPVVCLDEKSKQLLKDTRGPLPMRPGMPVRWDYEYKRAGTCNLFVAVEPKGGRRTVSVTARRAKRDFVAFVRHLLEKVYARAHSVHFVLDNLNTHFRKCFEEVLGDREARKLLRRAVFHYTPKHASWLNMAEIEIASWSVSASPGACQTAPHSLPRSMHGNGEAMQTGDVSGGRSPVRTRTRNWPRTMLRK